MKLRLVISDHLDLHCISPLTGAHIVSYVSMDTHSFSLPDIQLAVRISSWFGSCRPHLRTSCN